MNIHAIEEIKDADGGQPAGIGDPPRARPDRRHDVLGFSGPEGETKAERTIRIADGDRKKPTLSGMLSARRIGWRVRPRGTEIGDVTEWVTEVVSQMASDQVSLVLDMGASDTMCWSARKDR